MKGSGNRWHDPARVPSYRERIERELRGAAHELDPWVEAADLETRVAPENALTYQSRLSYMANHGQARVDRSRGKGRYRYALFTPQEMELLFTRFVLAGNHGFEAVYGAQKPDLIDSGPKTTTSPSLVSTPS